MANTLREDDKGIHCEIEYDDNAPEFEDIFENDFKSDEATVKCYLYEVTDTDTLSISKVNSDSYEARVMDLTEHTFTIVVTFPTEDFDFVATELSAVSLD